MGGGHPIPAAAVTDPLTPSALPDFLNRDRPPVPDLVVPRGVLGFHLAEKPVRGRFVRLGPLAEAILSRHEAPPVVSTLVGEALVLVAALASGLKFRGSFSLQARGDGPVPMLLADCTDTGALRGYARADHERLAALLAQDPAPSAAALLGQGFLAFTCDQGPEMDRYQGIVTIAGQSLAEMTQHYFATSEQLDAVVRLACAPGPEGWRAAGLVMERIAGAGGIGISLDEAEQQDAWHTALALATTLTPTEMLDDTLPPERLLHRLFHAEGLVLGRPRALSYGCRCSRARLAGVLSSFPAAELDEMAEDGTITMTCEFCNLAFRFDRAGIRGADSDA